MPYFALRRHVSPLGESRWKSRNGSPLRLWTDLTFLNLQTPKDERSQYGMLEAQISFVICGSANMRWAGYAFVDTAFDDEDLEDDCFVYDGFHEDPISLLDADLPIWDARQYFLRIVKISMFAVLKEWEYLVRNVERAIMQYVCLDAFDLIPQKTCSH